MLKSLNKIVAFLLIASLLVGIGFPSSAFAAYVEEGSVIPEGEYPVSFRYVKDGTTEESAAYKFVDQESGKLIISNGKAVFEHEVSKANYATFAYLAARKPGAAKAVIATVSGVEGATGKEGYETVAVRDASDPNNVVVQFAIEDVWKSQDILMHINDLENYFELPVRYNHWYNAQLEIYVADINLPENPGGGEEQPVDSEITEELFAERIAEGNTLLEEAVEGDYDGTYPAGSKAKLQAKLELAENLVGEDSGNGDILEAAYKIADQAIKTFKASRITVDKTRLMEWINIASEWVEGKADAGVRETGKPANISSSSVSDGEYLPQQYYGPVIGFKGPVTDMREQIAKALLVVDNAEATQAQVTEIYNESNAKGNWELFEKQRLAAYDIEIMVLDSLEEDAQISPHADDISSNAILLQQKGPGYYQTFANFAFYNADNTLTNTSIRQVNASGGLFGSWVNTLPSVVNQLDATNTPLFQAQLEGEHADTIKVYQTTTIRGASVTDEVWQGLWKLQYPMELPEAERKTVFISFNKAYLASLQERIEEAQLLLDAAEEGIAIGQHSAYYIAQLETAIATAQETVEHLSAPRPAIIQAEAALQATMDAFNAAQTREVYFTAAHSSLAEFSVMNDYFVKPALVTTDDNGAVHVTLTITDSSSVASFKVKAGQEYVAASIVSENSESDTKVVTFEIDSLAALFDAQVTLVDTEKNEAATHNIRLNFNNVNNQVLYELIQTAVAAHKKVVEGGSTGQYYELALTSLSNAIVLASEEAVKIPSEQASTDAAKNRLSNALETFNGTVDGGSNENPGTNPGNPGTNPGTGSTYPADGYYYMDFTILRNDSDGTSMANDYVVSPALVSVQGSKRTVSFTVKQSAEIKSFTINGQSEKVVSRNTKNNTRVISFSLTSLSQQLDGTVRVDWNAFDYHHTYNIRISFDESSASLVTEANPSVPGSDEDGNVGVDDGKVDDYNGTDTQPVEDKEVDKDKEQPSNGQEAGTNTVVFSDTASHWAKDNIDKAVKWGIVNGFSDGSFRPNATVTRAEFAVMLSRALKLEAGDTSTLTDYAAIPSWAQKHVDNVIDKGIIQGYEDGSFRPNVQLTRAQLAVMIARAANLQLDSNAELSFEDGAQIPTWAQKEIAAAVKAGLILGKENNRFDPNGTATRAEALTLIIRLLEKADA